jgi:hypothetical protein
MLEVFIISALGYPDSVVMYDGKRICVDCAYLYRYNPKDTLFKKYCKMSKEKLERSKKAVVCKGLVSSKVPHNPPPPKRPYEWKCVYGKCEYLSYTYDFTPPDTFVKRYGDGEVILVKNPLDTTLRATITTIKSEVMKQIDLDLKEGNIKAVFFYVRLGNEPTNYQLEEGQSSPLWLWLFIPAWDIYEEEKAKADYQIFPELDITPYLFIKTCPPDSLTSWCKIEADPSTEDSPSGIEGFWRTIGKVFMALGPHNEVVVYISPFYGR